MSTTTSTNALGLSTGTWQIDPAHSTVAFVVRHLMVSKVRGHFERFTGSITVAENLVDSSVTADIETASISTNDETRDKHIRSADFLDVETHPSLTFRSTSIESSGNDFVVNGELTLHGVTKPVALALEFNGVGNDPWGGTRSGFSAVTEINRRDFGVDISMPLDGGGVVVADKIKIELEIEAILQAS